MKPLTTEPNDVIAVGDIHGRFDLLSRLVNHLRDTQITLIFLGDLIDRGPQDVECLSLVKTLTEVPEAFGLSQAYCIRGNHEQMLIDACGENPVCQGDWIFNGGDFVQWDNFRPFVPWLEELPLVIYDLDTIFVHAGVVPGEAPETSIAKGRSRSLFWMRDPFLRIGPCLEKWTNQFKKVVHGHTPNQDDECYLLPYADISPSGDRIGIDTGAVFSGILTAYNNTGNYFIHVTEEEITTYS